MTDYNDGRWHGWNGGECPVHPESVVYVATEIGFASGKAEEWMWENDLVSIVAFRVVKPYVKPVTYEGECWAYHYTSLGPSLTGSKTSDRCIPGKWTATHVNGRLKSIIWEADE